MKFSVISRNGKRYQCSFLHTDEAASWIRNHPHVLSVPSAVEARANMRRQALSVKIGSKKNDRTLPLHDGIWRP
jgi:hypothetical protein